MRKAQTALSEKPSPVRKLPVGLVITSSASRFDLTVNARNGSAYEIGGEEADGAATAAISVSYRF